MYQDIAQILTDATFPLDELRLDYRLGTGSLWQSWEEDLSGLLDRIEWINDEAHCINATFKVRNIVLDQARNIEGTWPHHFLVRYFDECEGYLTYCQRCHLSDNDFDFDNFNTQVCSVKFHHADELIPF